MPERDKLGRWKKGSSGNLNGRPQAKNYYPDALRKWLSLTPKELANQIKQPLSQRQDITVLEAWALIDASQGLILDNLDERRFVIERTEGRPEQRIRNVSDEFVDDTADDVKRLTDKKCVKGSSAKNTRSSQRKRKS